MVGVFLLALNQGFLLSLLVESTHRWVIVLMMILRVTLPFWKKSTEQIYLLANSYQQLPESETETHLQVQVGQILVSSIQIPS